jgi:homoserine acetyltransferase
LTWAARRKKWRRRFGNARARWLVVSFSSDWLFPPDQSRDIVNALIANTRRSAIATCAAPAAMMLFCCPMTWPFMAR